MTKKILLNLTLFITLISQAFSLSAAFVHGEVWRKWSTELKDYQYIYFLGDCHINACRDSIDSKIISNVEKQKSAFYKSINGLNKKDTLFLYENPCLENGKPNLLATPSNEFICSRHIVEQGFDVLSCENRTILESFFKYCGLWPNSNPEYYGSFFQNDLNKKAKDSSIYKFIENFENQVLNLISKDKDLKKYLDDFRNNQTIRLIKKHKETNFSDLVRILKKQHPDAETGILEIIEINILDLIQNTNNKKKVVVVVGALHIEEIQDSLNQMSYEKVYTKTSSEYKNFIVYSKDASNITHKEFCIKTRSALSKSTEPSFYESFFNMIVDTKV